MIRRFVVVLVVVLSVTTMGVGALPITAQSPSDADRVPPGVHLTSAVDVHDTELRGELDERSFRHRLADAHSADAKADIVHDRLTKAEKRVEELQDQLADIEEAWDNGEMPRGRYVALSVRLEVEREMATRALNHSIDVSADLPEEALAAHGITDERVDKIRALTDQEPGRERGELAREIIGALSDTPPGHQDHNRSIDRPGPPRD